MNKKQEALKEALEEIRQENRLVEQKRIERESDEVEKRMSLPEGRGPHYHNREEPRRGLKALRYFARRKEEGKEIRTMHMPRSRNAK